MSTIKQIMTCKELYDYVNQSQDSSRRMILVNAHTHESFHALVCIDDSYAENEPECLYWHVSSDEDGLIGDADVDGSFESEGEKIQIFKVN